jgi:5'-3' exonuclease
MDVKLITAILVTAFMASAALAQGPSAEKLKADAQEVVKIISSDGAKAQTYCETVKLGDQMDQAEQNNDSNQMEDLSKKMDELNEKLGPEYLKLSQDLQDIDPNSPDGLELARTLAALDKLCK